MASWTYSDWITYDVGAALRLSRLRLHIQEVSDALADPASAAGQGQSASKRDTTAYLARLGEKEAEIAAASSTLYEKHSVWVP